MESLVYWLGNWHGRIVGYIKGLRRGFALGAYPSNDPLDAYGDALRQALHTEADAVVPAPDGLDRIRARTTFVCDPCADSRAQLGHSRGHDLIAVAALALLLLFTLGGS